MRIAPEVAASKAAGFSQGDLLLLLGSLLILASAGLSAISRAKENSRLSQCLDNVKIINGAFLDHARDNGGKLLTAKTTPPPGGWWAYKDKIRPYLKKTAGAVASDEKLFA
ncbi:MAG: hypothetical protein FJ405_16355, partial [Verrucomicrobia bacterium]|nr:hypothetical protein [Verrucomicrobiota bacterium]